MDSVFYWWNIVSMNYDSEKLEITVNWKCNAWINPEAQLNMIDNFGAHTLGTTIIKVPADYPVEGVNENWILSECYKNGVNKLSVENQLASKVLPEQ
jgi:hypothetical protein